MCTVLSHLRRESHGKTGKGDVMPGVRRDEMEEMEEDEMDAMDNVKSGETGVMNGVVSTRAVGKVSLFFFANVATCSGLCWSRGRSTLDSHPTSVADPTRDMADTRWHWNCIVGICPLHMPCQPRNPAASSYMGDAWAGNRFHGWLMLQSSSPSSPWVFRLILFGVQSLLRAFAFCALIDQCLHQVYLNQAHWVFFFLIPFVCGRFLL